MMNSKKDKNANANNGLFTVINDESPIDRDFIHKYLESIKKGTDIDKSIIKMQEDTIYDLNQTVNQVIDKNKLLEEQCNAYKWKAEALERLISEQKNHQMDNDVMYGMRPYEIPDEYLECAFVAEERRRDNEAYQRVLEMATRSALTCVKEADDPTLPKEEAYAYATVFLQVANKVWKDFLNEIDLARIKNQICDILIERRNIEKETKNKPSEIHKHYHGNAKDIEHVDNYNEK